METPFSRVCDARQGYLTKYNLPLSKAVVAPVAAKVSPPASAHLPRASRPDGMTPVQTKSSRVLPFSLYFRVAPNAFLGDASACGHVWRSPLPFAQSLSWAGLGRPRSRCGQKDAR